jgi:glycine cleavage system H protein
VAEESYPEELKYHAEHDWARIEGDTATFGITWYAQDALGEVVFFDPPEAGSTTSTPEKINEDPYGEGWLVKVRLSDPGEVDSLMDVGAYRDLLQSGAA